MLDFMIIGAQKSGSTALMRQLSEHPEVFLPEAETQYFRDPWFHLQDRSVLEDAVSAAPRGVLRGIKCPDYLAEDHCAERILEAIGAIPLIAVLREPVERAVSAYFWGMQWGWIPLLPPEVGLLRILDGSLAAKYPRAKEVLEYGLYGQHLRRYASLFGREMMLVISDEELRDHPDRALAATFAHIGASSSVRRPLAGRSVNAGVYSMARLRVLKVRHKHILRSFPGHEGRYLQPPANLRGRIVNRGVAAFDRIALERLLPNDRPVLPAHVTHALADYYRNDLLLLADVTGRDVTDWMRRYETASTS